MPSTHALSCQPCKEGLHLTGIFVMGAGGAAVLCFGHGCAHSLQALCRVSWCAIVKERSSPARAAAARAPCGQRCAKGWRKAKTNVLAWCVMSQHSALHN